MSASNVVSNVVPVNKNAPVLIGTVCQWVEAHVEKGNIPATSGRLKVTSLTQLAAVLTNDEPKGDARYLLENLDAITRRWLTKNPSMKPDTARTYESRARSALETYFRWLADPKAFKFEIKEPGERRKPEPKTVVTATPMAAPASAPEPAHVISPLMGETRNFPMGPGRGAFNFVLPADGITFADVRKIACHLFTLASDFNIADEGQARVFTMVVRNDAG